jgi:hypothetical protein
VGNLNWRWTLLGWLGALVMRDCEWLVWGALPGRTWTWTRRLRLGVLMGWFGGVGIPSSEWAGTGNVQRSVEQLVRWALWICERVGVRGLGLVSCCSLEFC